MRIPDECTYYKEDAGKLLIGAFEPVAKPWGTDGIPEDHAFETLPEDMDHFEPILADAVKRVPLLETAGIALFFNGPESFTPDDRYYLGEAPEIKDLFVATGFNSIGIQSSGGAGKVLAEWIKTGHPPMDVNGVDIRRIHPFQSVKRYVRDRTVESLGLLYAMHWPYRQVETARGVRRSPIHDRLKALGACFGELNGWERPNWYAPKGVEPAYEYSFGRQNWWPYADAEAKALQGKVAFFDQSSFAKFLVEGADAAKVLNRISANEVDVEPGRIVYTQWLQRARRHRGRPHGHAPRRDALHGGDRRGAADPRFRLAQGPHPRRRALRGDRHHLGPADDRRHGALEPRPARQALGRGPVERRVPVRPLARDRDRLCARAGKPHHLCRRARLGALHSGGIRRPCLRHICGRPGRNSA